MPNERGFAPILILLAASGIIVFILISSSASFKDQLLSRLYPKPSSHASENMQSVPGEVVIKFKAGVDDEEKENVRRAHGMEKKDEVAQIGVELAKVPEQARDAVIEALSHNPRVEYAEPNYLGEALDIPNDPSMASFSSLVYSNAWHLDKISAPEAWEISQGNSEVIVAVIDSGIKLDHEDLVGKLVPGYNYYDNNADATDLYGHGTKVAGIVGAATNNSKGVASLGRNVMIMPLRVTSSTGSGSSYATTQAITYATDNGAKIINISLGWGSIVYSVRDAINTAWGKGVLTVAAAGNKPETPLAYPAVEPIVISAGMTQSTDSWIGSNYGPNLDVVAPGYNIHTTNSAGGYGSGAGSSFSSPLTAALAALIFSANPNLTPQQVTDIITSTADKVSGASTYGGYDGNGWNDHYGYGRINAQSALQKAVGLPVNPPDTQVPTVSISSPSSNSTVSSLIDITSDVSDNVGVTKVDYYLDGVLLGSDTSSPYVALLDTTTLTNGSSHTLSAKAYDNAGNIGASSVVTVTINNPVATPTPTPTTAPTSTPVPTAIPAATATPTPTPVPVVSDTTSPSVSITSPANGLTVKPSSKINITSSASDNIKISKVEFYVNNSLKCTSTLSTGSYACAYSVPGKKNTSYAILVKAYDTSNNINSASVTIKAQ